MPTEVLDSDALANFNIDLQQFDLQSWQRQQQLSDPMFPTDFDSATMDAM